MTQLTAGEPLLGMGDILNATLGLLRANAVRAAVAFASIAGLGIVFDLGLAGRGIDLGYIFISLALQYWLTASLLKLMHLKRATKPRLLPYLLLSIAISIGVIVGLIFLIIPGIMFIVRWSIAVPAVLGSDAGVFESIEYSWRATEPHAWRILGALVVIYVIAAVAVVAGGSIEAAGLREWGAAIVELSLSAAYVVSWHLSVAVFAELQRSGLYSDVFA
jgi:hypothetical protein